MFTHDSDKLRTHWVTQLKLDLVLAVREWNIQDWAGLDILVGVGTKGNNEETIRGYTIATREGNSQVSTLCRWLLEGPRIRVGIVKEGGHRDEQEELDPAARG